MPSETQSIGRSALAPVAYLRIRGRTGIFAAESWTRSGGMVTARGRTRWRTGIGYEEVRWGPLRTYHWRVSDVLKIEEIV